MIQDGNKFLLEKIDWYKGGSLIIRLLKENNAAFIPGMRSWAIKKGEVENVATKLKELCQELRIDFKQL